MQLIYDHLIAVLLGGTVLFVLLASQREAAGLSAEQSALYMARHQVESFSGWLQHDLTRAGEDLREGDSRFDMPTQRDDGLTARFSFSRDTLASDIGGGTRLLRLFVRYQLQVTGDSATVGRNAQGRPTRVPLYGVTREEQLQPVVNGTATPAANAWAATGGAPGLLTYFRVEAIKRGDAPATDQYDAEYLRVRFSLAPPYDIEGRYLNELHWGTTVGLRPF